MQISDEAVEAAARAYRDQQAELGYPKWEDLPEDGREWRRDYMRASLEAAAPHMFPSDDAIREAMADGWDECERARYVISLNPTGTAWEAIKTNPYRSQGVTKVGALDDALRMYGEGVALAVITERTGVSYSGLMKAKKDRGIPDRPQRADGTDRSGE